MTFDYGKETEEKLHCYNFNHLILHTWEEYLDDYGDPIYPV